MPDTETVSHDQNFKNLILDYPLDALRLFCPEAAEDIPETVTITPVRQEQLKERLGSRYRELDVPLLVDWPDGTREALLFAVEEETTSRKFSITRLAHYCLDLVDLFETTRLVPVVIFLNTTRKEPGQLRVGKDPVRYLDFRYVQCRLSDLSAEDYWDTDNIVARLCLSLMHWPEEKKLEVYARATRGLMELEPDLNRQQKYLDFIDIYADLDDNERQQYLERYAQEGNQVTLFADRFIAKGEASALKKIIARKFGDIPEWAENRIDGADVPQIEVWLDAVITADTLDFLKH